MTDNQLGVPAVALGVIVAGVVLAFAAAVIPHYSAGYHLAGGVLFVALLPFLAYGALLRVLRAGAAVACGLVLLLVNAAVMLPQRFMYFDGYADGWVYYVPLLTTLIVLPVFLVLGRRAPSPARGAEDSL